MKLEKKIAIARRVSGKSLRALSDDTGLSNPLISQIETGLIKNPSFSSVVKIARALGLSLDDLATSVPEQRKSRP